MNTRNSATTAAAIKLGIFTMVSIIVTGTLAAIMGNFGFGSQTQYKALFSTASMIQKGDDVRVAGVTVGEVKNVQIKDRTNALVTFSVKSDVPLTTASRAEIRFLNLIGSRYLSLSQGAPGATRLRKDQTIGMDHTSPALNLTELFNGFQPLFQALSPNDVNQLSLNLVRVLQGEGGTIRDLLGNTASLTNSLADRDQLIGEVIGNLGTMLKTVDDRHSQLNTLVIELKNWLTNVSNDRGTIGASLHSVSGLSAQLASLLTQSRPYIKDDVAALRKVLKVMNTKKNKGIIDGTLTRLPKLLTRQTRAGSYGSWYNYYLCDFKGTIILPQLVPGQPNSAIPGLAQIQAQLTDMSFHSTAGRCTI